MSSTSALVVSLLTTSSAFTASFTPGVSPSSRASFAQQKRTRVSTSMSVGSSFPEDHDLQRPSPPEVYDRHEYDLNHLSPSEERQSRFDIEEEAMSRFKHGDDLMELRKRIELLTANLRDARNDGDLSKMSAIKSEITDAQRKDAELMYQLAMERSNRAEEQGLPDEAEKYENEAMAARSVLPQYNIEGLWVGKYGDHGYEMINVTYVEDTIVAYKVTGDQNVPKGEVSFTVDLGPEALSEAGLEPIELAEDASSQWGTKHLPRFPGKGQVAAEGFVNNQWIEGQLIIVGDYFSFAWVPLGHQIFFGRPSAELTLKMLRENKMKELQASPGELKDVAEMRAFALRCWEETEQLESDLETEGMMVDSKPDPFDGGFQ